MYYNSWKSVVGQAISEERKLVLLSGNKKIGEYEDIVYNSSRFDEDSEKLYLYTSDADGNIHLISYQKRQE